MVTRSNDDNPRLFMPDGMLTSQALAGVTSLRPDEVSKAFAGLAEAGLLKAETDRTYSWVENPDPALVEEIEVRHAMDAEDHRPEHEVEAVPEWLREDGEHWWGELRTIIDFRRRYDDVLADYRRSVEPEDRR